MNKSFLVTAGPTHEKIDPVRFIGNYSSGKMGFAIAERLADLGATVYLVAGPVELACKSRNIKRIDVVSADEMYQASSEIFDHVDGAVLCAAVADYAPLVTSDEKIKRDKGNLIIELRPNRDIAASLGERKRDNQLLVGFALETSNERENAILKLNKKNLDFIVLNSLKEEGAGFKVNTNKISILSRTGEQTDFPLKSKREVASDIVDKMIETMPSLLSLH